MSNYEASVINEIEEDNYFIINSSLELIFNPTY